MIMLIITFVNTNSCHSYDTHNHFSPDKMNYIVYTHNYTFFC